MRCPDRHLKGAEARPDHDMRNGPAVRERGRGTGDAVRVVSSGGWPSGCRAQWETTTAAGIDKSRR